MTEIERIASPMIAPDTPSNLRWGVIGALNYCPIGIVALLAEHHTRYRCIGKDESFASVSRTIRSWPEAMRQGVDRESAVFVSDERTIYARNTAPALIVHESGHALDHIWGNHRDHLSRHHPRVVGEYNRAKETGAVITRKALEGPNEFFAEAIRANFGVGSDVTRERLFDLHPQTCMIVDRAVAREQQRFARRTRWFAEAYVGLTEDGQQYTGEIVDTNESLVLQDVGRGVVVAHQSGDLARVPDTGERVVISYRDGRARVEPIERGDVVEIAL